MESETSEMDFSNRFSFLEEKKKSYMWDLNRKWFTLIMERWNVAPNELIH